MIPAYGKWLLFFSLFFAAKTANTQTELACNDAVQISLDASCEALITPDILLENYDANKTYDLQIKDTFGASLGAVANASMIGQTLDVEVFLVENGTPINSCWGSIVVEDKHSPTVNCLMTPIVLMCTENANDVPFPTASDNCDNNPVVQQIDEIIDPSSQCIDLTIGDNIAGFVRIIRTFIASDASGNSSTTCQQEIQITRPATIDFPEDIVFSCTQFDNYPNITDSLVLTCTGLMPNVSYGDALDATHLDTVPPTCLQNTGAGRPIIAQGTYCNYALSHADDTLFTCGSSFKIVRTWTVIDWCSGDIIQHNDENENGIQDANEEDNIQIIKVLDIKAPMITQTTFTLSANVAAEHPAICSSTELLLPATVHDDCNAFEVRIFTPIGEAIYTNGNDGSAGGTIPEPGLDLGIHTIVYQAIDLCGNMSELAVDIEVIDDIAPTPICDELTQVNLSTDGLAIVEAIDLNDGSHDNCHIEFYRIRRISDNCNLATNTIFSESVTFCCEDIDAGAIDIVLQIEDASGNTNECMIQVSVEDKIPPIKLETVVDATLTCDFYQDNLATMLSLAENNGDTNPAILIDLYGEPVYQDGCDFTLTHSYTNTVNNCGEGEITRMWQAVDANGNIAPFCQQTITVEHLSDFVVEFPEDLTFNCGDTLSDFGEPNIIFDDCELMAISFEDVEYYVSGDACYKILREYTIINWCEYENSLANILFESPENALPGASLDSDGDKDERTFKDGLNTVNYPNAQADGVIMYTQTIKIIDNEAPIMTLPDTLYYEITTSVCGINITLPMPEVQDCNENYTVSANSDLGLGFGPFEEVAPGIYDLIYTATDHCGNQSSVALVIEVVDAKAPTPYCQNLIVEIMPMGMVEVCTPLLNAGAFDNCSDTVFVSFSPDDISDTCLMLTCLDINDGSSHFIYFSDEAGNIDACEITIELQDNNFTCIARPEIRGIIETENGMPLEEIEIHLNSLDNALTYSDLGGEYSFENIDADYDYTVTPVDYSNYVEQVTTYDLVLISQHILGTNPLSSPYKIIAADANGSNSVTTADIVQLKRLILQVQDDLPNVGSYRFINKNYVFPNPQNPWEDAGFPEVINLNNLSEDVLDADFIGVKVGHVN